MHQNQPKNPQQAMLIGFVMMAAFTMFQLFLMLILKFILVPDQAPSVDGFASIVTGNEIAKVFLAACISMIIAQQILKSKFLGAGRVTTGHLVVLLVLGEIPGLLGFASALLAKENLSFAVPMMVLSILSFVTLKPVVLKLGPNGVAN